MSLAVVKVKHFFGWCGFDSAASEGRLWQLYLAVVKFQVREAPARSTGFDPDAGNGENWYRLPGLNGGPLDPQSSALTN